MSPDPSPWGEEPSVWSEPDPTDTTAEILRQDMEDQALARQEDFTNDRLWELYAQRLAADGSLIR